MTDLKKLKEALHDHDHDENVRIANNEPVSEEQLAALRFYSQARYSDVRITNGAARSLVAELEELRAYKKLLPIETALELVRNLIGVAGAVRRGLASGQLEKVEDARRYLWDVPE
jgi:hypothetical protein